jgi:hypothetical protein
MTEDDPFRRALRIKTIKLLKKTVDKLETNTDLKFYNDETLMLYLERIISRIDYNLNNKTNLMSPEIIQCLTCDGFYNVEKRGAHNMTKKHLLKTNYYISKETGHFVLNF